MKKLFLSAICLCFGFSINFAQKLECGFVETPCSAFAKANAVFTGTVTKVVQPSLEIWMRDKDYDQKAFIRVEKVYKGPLRSRIVLIQLSKRVAPKFVGRASYLFYANYDKKLRIWEVKLCTRTQLLRYASDDLMFLDSLPSSSTKTRVSGEIIEISPTPDDEHKRLANFKIKIIGESKEYETTTDKNGVYELYGLPPGKYFIKIENLADLEFYGAMHSVPDPLSRAKNLDFELKENECASVNIMLIKRENKEKVNAN